MNSVFEQTPTTILCGLLTLKVGVIVVSLWTIVEGACQFYVAVGEPIFHWGPSLYERQLQIISGAVGVVAVAYGSMGIAAARSCKATLIRRFRRIQYVLFLWSALWFALVGAPTSVEYITVPAIELWGPLDRFSSLPGLPTMQIVDPNWPDGKPTVCDDVDDMKSNLVKILNSKQKHRWLRQILRKVYNAIFKRLLTCKQTLKVFWLWCAATLAFRVYCISVVNFFLEVVLHGGDGVMMIGKLDDLYKPYNETRGSMALVKDQVVSAFNEMDTDGDGRLSLEELLQYLEGSNARYKGIAGLRKSRTASVTGSTRASVAAGTR